MSIKRIFHDPIHKEIVFDSGKPEELMIMELIDTIAFQRLRRIKQLGAASLLFHGAESSRFTHSIGVFCIARQILNKLIERKSTFSENLENPKILFFASITLVCPVKVDAHNVLWRLGHF